jgi:hypothetical protein
MTREQRALARTGDKDEGKDGLTQGSGSTSLEMKKRKRRAAETAMLYVDAQDSKQRGCWKRGVVCGVATAWSVVYGSSAQDNGETGQCQSQRQLRNAGGLGY